MILFSGTKVELDIELIAANYRRGIKNEPSTVSHVNEYLQSKSVPALGTDSIGVI
jgi:hypothetical protein